MLAVGLQGNEKTAAAAGEQNASSESESSVFMDDDMSDNELAANNGNDHEEDELMLDKPVDETDETAPSGASASAFALSRPSRRSAQEMPAASTGDPSNAALTIAGGARQPGPPGHANRAQAPSGTGKRGMGKGRATASMFSESTVWCGKIPIVERRESGKAAVGSGECSSIFLVLVLEFGFLVSI